MLELIEKTEAELFELQDLAYRDFQSRLMPTVPKENIIGVRTPALRKYAAEFAGSGNAAEFMEALPHRYYEEDNLHGFLIEKIRDFEECMEALDAFLPYVNNWATCDMMSPKVLKKYPQELLEAVKRWISSEHVYEIRFAIGCLMKYYLDGNFTTQYADMAAAVKSEEYYIKMMQAWYFATALAKQPEQILPYIEEKRLEPWVHNKAIQKAAESYRITPEQKEYLKTLKIK